MTCVLVCARYTDNAALLQQVQLYEEGLMRDREEAAMPGGVDITDHQQVFSALFEKVPLHMYNNEAIPSKSYKILTVIRL